MKNIFGWIQAKPVTEFSTRELLPGRSPRDDWGTADLLLPAGMPITKYLVGFAGSTRCVEAAQRLRFEVFNLELNEGLASAYAEGLDRDPFDDQMTHLVLVERATGRIAGTYRLQTAPQALAGLGLYSAQEYNLALLTPYFETLVECGRACLAQRHRNFAALVQLWRGIHAFLKLSGGRWLFGCCSITARDPQEGWRALPTLRRMNAVHPELWLCAQPEYSCGAPPTEAAPVAEEDFCLPKLFSTYLRLGAKVISEPALDRAFGTVDFLVLFDQRDLALTSLDITR